MVINFIISEGWNPTDPNLSHLWAPFTSKPILGIKTKIRRNKPKPSKSLSNLSQKDKGIDNRRLKKSNPASKWKSCFVNKFKGSPVKETENWIDALATANKPNIHKKIK